MAKLKAQHWDHLLHLSDDIGARLGEAHLSPAELRACLVSAAEVFKSHAEPTEDYASYAFLRFARSLEAALAETDRGVPMPQSPLPAKRGGR